MTNFKSSIKLSVFLYALKLRRKFLSPRDVTVKELYDSGMN